MSSAQSKSEELPIADEDKISRRASDDSSNKRRKIETEQDDIDDPDKQIKETIQKLKKFLLQDSKFSKAIELMTQLIQNHFREGIAELMISTVEDVCNQRDVLGKDFKSGCKNLVETLCNKRTDLNPSQIFRVDTLHILVVLQNGLITDDSFDYARCCTSVTSFITCIPSYSRNLEEVEIPIKQRESLIIHRVNAIINCMRTAFKLYSTRPWSKQPVDVMFTSSADVRLHLPLGVRETMDTLITLLRNTQRKNASFTGPMTIRTFNSTAHPLRSSKNDILK